MLVVFVVGVAIHDVTQRRHAILRNFPVVGHFRYLIEKIGPEPPWWLTSPTLASRWSNER